MNLLCGQRIDIGAFEVEPMVDDGDEEFALNINGRDELEDNNDEEPEVAQGLKVAQEKNGLRPHASVPRPAGLVQDCEELWRNYDMLTDMRPLTREPETAPFGVGTQVFGAGCGEVSGSCKVPTGLPSAKQEDERAAPKS